jgi:hypothetical protein
MRRSILIKAVLAFVAVVAGSCVQAQYELDEMAVHAGAGMRMLSGDGAQYLGPGAHAQVSFAHYPCGKAFAIEGRAGLNYGRASSADGAIITGNPLAGKTTLSWAGGEVAAAFKVRLHEYHRPREFAFLVGPKVNFPVLARYASEAGSGGMGSTGILVNRIAPAIFAALQFRRPAPDKKFWFIEPGFEFNPTPLFRRDSGTRLGALYLYLQFGFAFWDQRG